MPRRNANRVKSYRNKRSYDDDEEYRKCFICGEGRERLLFKCIDHACNEWYCNKITPGTTPSSHVYYHLNLRGHNVIKPNNIILARYGDLKCFECSNRNVFSLGFLSRKIQTLDDRFLSRKIPTSKKPSSLRELNDKKRIICRCPCFIKRKILAFTWDHVFREKVIKYPGGECDHPESFNNRGRYIQIDNNGYEIPEWVRVTVVYPDLDFYIKVYIFLMELENEYNINNPPMPSRNVLLYHRNPNNLRVIKFYGDEIGMKIRKQENINVYYYLQDDIEYHNRFFVRGIVNSIERGLYTLGLDYGIPYPDVTEVDLDTEIKPNPIAKIIRGLNEFRNHNIDPDIARVLLGTDFDFQMTEPEGISYQINGLHDLNEDQQNAVYNAIKYKFSIIQGPPGTGKTETIAYIVYIIFMIYAYL
jgi:RNA helicase (UPF2 interacting domain)/AAA domain